MPYVKGGHNDKIFPWKKREGYPNRKDIGIQTDSKPMTTDTQIETNPSSVNVQGVNLKTVNAATQTKAKNQDIKTMPTLKHAYGKIIIQNITCNVYIISSCSCSS